MASSSSTSSPSSEQLCQSCGTRPARNHLCQIIHSQQTTLDLCDVCLHSHTAQTGFELPSLEGAQCFYCGGVATSAGMNQAWEISSRHQCFHYTCFRCAQLSHQFTTEVLSSIAKGLPPEDQLHRIEQIVRDVDARVRAAVRSDIE
jgi:protein-arginine kinase activator protein McsA